MSLSLSVSGILTIKNGMLFMSVHKETCSSSCDVAGIIEEEEKAVKLDFLRDLVLIHFSMTSAVASISDKYRINMDLIS